MIVQELLGDTHECFLGPVVEPVDACAVDNCWKFPPPHPQGGSHRGEAEDDLQLLPHPVDEELPTVFPSVHDPRAFGFIPHLVDDVLNFVVGKEIWNLSRRQKIVD